MKKRLLAVLLACCMAAGMANAVFAAAASSTLPALRRHLPCKGRQGTLAPSARGLRPQAVGERTYRQATIYTTVTSVSQSPVTAYLPLPAGIK